MQTSYLLRHCALFLMLLMSGLAQADNEDLFKDQGWNWYEKEEQAKQSEQNQSQANLLKDPLERRDAERLALHRALYVATENPTVENVKKYYDLQREKMRRGYEFQKVWKEMLLQYPEADFSLIHPADSLARKIEVDEVNRLEEKAIAFFAKESGLFFFYKSTCPYCKSFAPILKRFAELYHMSVIPITLDGISIKEFPESNRDAGQAALFNVKVEPALFIVNPYTKKAIPFSFGLLSESDLKRRFLEIAQKINGSMLR